LTGRRSKVRHTMLNPYVNEVHYLHLLVLAIHRRWHKAI